MQPSLTIFNSMQHARRLCALRHRQQARHRLPTVLLRASAYTQPAVDAIRQAQQEALRQGSMFVAPPHLLLGVLRTPRSAACELLSAAGLTPMAAEDTLVDAQALPQSSSMGPGDLHWAPDARTALDTAAGAAQAAGVFGCGC
jgi:ATP-dependent Clp protease ATP-binding subunit ClpA